MKRIRRLSTVHNSDREGSVIAVVLALTIGLLILAMLLYTDASQEEISAEYFAGSGQVVDPSLDNSRVAYDALRQIILGANDTERHSPFYGGRRSLLPTMFGRQRSPFNGPGVNVGWDGAGGYYVDQDHNGVADPINPAQWIRLNDSPAVNGGTDYGNATNFPMAHFGTFPSPAAGYTYPDFNSAFLSYHGRVRDPNPSTGPIQDVMIPSYMRPQLLRNVAPAHQWFSSTMTQGRHMRPHLLTRSLLPSNGAQAAYNSGGGPVFRFISSTHPETIAAAARGLDGQPGVAGMDDDGNGTVDDASEMHWPGSDDIQRFPFDEDTNGNGILDAGEDTNGNGVLDTFKFGVWANHTEDTNGNGMLDSEDTNGNGMLDAGEDTNGNGVLDVEDKNGNGVIDYIYSLDRDLDGDGIKESILLDMDLGVFTTPDGTRKFVPIVAAKLVPLDDKFDLNGHGNSNRILQANGSSNPSDMSTGLTAYRNTFLSRSNQAVSRSEVNPQWALRLAGPSTDMQPYQRYYGRAPNGTDATDTANMEWWWLLTGRPEFDAGGSTTGLLPGRYGEVTRMRDALNGASVSFPGPGQTGADDNGNAREGGVYAGNLDVGTWVFPSQVIFPRNGHPVDYRGRGSYVQTSGSFQGVGRLFTASSRQLFPTYQQYYVNPPQWPSTFLTNFQPTQIIDEPNEMAQGLTLDVNQHDARFDASQTATLHMSNSALMTTNRDQDLSLKLAPWAFQNAPVPMPPNPNRLSAEQVRKLFTTVTGDVKTYGKTIGFRQNEFTNIGGTPNIFVFPPRIGTIAFGSTTTPIDPIREEVRELFRIRHNDRNHFPLQRRLSVNEFLDRYAPTHAQFPNQLRFRPLTPHVTGDDGSSFHLNNEPVSGTNSVLESVVTGGRFAITRPEQITGARPYHKQEWLARYDRQRMCRDIFMLLYLFGGRSDSVNYAGTPNTLDAMGNGAVYTARELREMAQFAVNLVDSRDEDDIPTIFEYDKNPINGWGLDDDPFTENDTATTVSPSERDVVIGVERQQLVISEALTFVARRTQNMGIPANHNATHYDDSEHHIFSYMELQNVTPSAVPFGRLGEQESGVWQIVVTGQDRAAMLNVVERRLTFRSAAGGSVGGVLPPVGTNNPYYAIGTQSNKNYTLPMSTEIAPSRFIANPNYDDAGTSPIQLIPRDITSSPAPDLNLDLMKPPAGTETRYRLNAPPTTSGQAGEGMTFSGVPSDREDPPGQHLISLINATTMTPVTMTDAALDNYAGTVTIRLQLRRRLHPHRRTPANPGGAAHHTQTADNPWVVVDEFEVPLKSFRLNDPNVKGKDLRDQLNTLFSSERYQPLDANNVKPYNQVNTMISPPDPTIYQLNSFRQVNQATASLVTPSKNPSGNFTLWQPQMDRPFSSIGELLTLPLYGDPIAVTNGVPQYKTETPKYLGYGADPANMKIALTNPTNPSGDPRTAYSRFLRPDKPDISATVAGNRWYRALSLLEIPEADPTAGPWYINRLGRAALPGVPGGPRNPTTVGLMNMNTMSHPAHLAGLLDDPNTFPLANLTATTLTDIPALGGRNWWDQFLKARDGVDPLNPTLSLPGVPGVSRPFRELSDRSNAATNNQLEHTVLRSLPVDSDPQTGRRLFELGTTLQHSNWHSEAYDSIDLTTRFRLLQKAMNNTTVRGNAYLLILRVEFFEAVEVDTNNMLPDGTPEKVVRIGGKLPGNLSPDITTYYVIDRSRAFQAIQPQDLPQVRSVDTNGDGTPDQDRFTWSFRQNMDFRQFILHEQRVD